jgi:hypothetical protein
MAMEQKIKTKKVGIDLLPDGPDRRLELLPDGPDRRLELLTDGPIDLSDGAVGERKEVSDYSDIVHTSFYQNLEISSFNSVYFHTVILEKNFRCKMKKNGLYSKILSHMF